MPLRFVEVVDVNPLRGAADAEVVRGLVARASRVVDAHSADLGALGNATARATARASVLLRALLAAALAVVVLRAAVCRLLAGRYLRAHGHARRAQPESASRKAHRE